MGKCTLMSAIAGGVLVMTSVSTAETNNATRESRMTPDSQPRIVKPIGSLSDDPRLKHFGLAKMPPAPEDGYSNAAFLAKVGPHATREELAQTNNIEAISTCPFCQPGFVEGGEGPLPTLWTEWGDAFRARPDAQAGNWLVDQGCFIITACFGSTNAAFSRPTPMTLPATSTLVPSGRICGFLSNFSAPNDAADAANISHFNFVSPNSPSNPAGCATYDPPNSPPPQTGNQRDQDAYEIFVPAGGINNFRLFATFGNEYEVIFYVNKLFPAPGDITSCWTDPGDSDSPITEHGFIAVTAGGGNSATTAGASGGEEGKANTTWAWPRNGGTFLPQGTYHIFIRPKTFGNLVSPPIAPSTRYEIRTQGTIGTGLGTGACCVLPSNTCQDNTLAYLCEEQPGFAPIPGGLGGVYKGDGVTCAQVAASSLPCNITPFTANEGAGADGCTNPTAPTDVNRGCDGLVPPLTLNTLPINPGQTIQGFTGGERIPPYGSVVIDGDFFQWDGTGTPGLVNVRFSLDSEIPMDFFVFVAPDTSIDLCEDLLGFGFGGNATPVRGQVIDFCIPGNSVVVVGVSPNAVPYPCGSPNGPTYKLTFTQTACNNVACCTLAGSCSDMTGPACYAAGGISLGEGTTCATSTCCSGASVCTGSTVTENGLPRRLNPTPTGSDACKNQSTLGAQDTFNGGCSQGNTTNDFSLVNPGQKVCATTSSFRFEDDADWYQLTVPAGVDPYVGVVLRAQVPLTATLFRKPAGVICTANEADLNPFTIGSAGVGSCDTEVAIIGDCLAAGTTLYLRVTSGFLEYDIPCTGGTTPAAQYYLEYITGPCTGTAVSCTGTAENESACQDGQINAGCNATTPQFGAIACNQTICGTADYRNNLRDLDWYQFTHPGGNLTVQWNAAFYGQVTVVRPGTTGPAGCDDFTVVDGRQFIQPNTATNFTVNALAAGTYWIIAGVDFDGTKTVCCSASSNYSLRIQCTPPSCKGDFNNDNLRNTADLVAFLGFFGQSVPPANPNADFNNDNQVNTADLVAFLGVFGVPCP